MLKIDWTSKDIPIERVVSLPKGEVAILNEQGRTYYEVGLIPVKSNDFKEVLGKLSLPVVKEVDYARLLHERDKKARASAQKHRKKSKEETGLIHKLILETPDEKLAEVLENLELI